LWDAVRKEVTHTYQDTDAQAGKLSAIFTDLITTYAGLTADATTVQDSGTVFTISKFLCNHTDPFERCKALATSLDWQFYYRADTDKVYFEPKGFTGNANTLTVGENVIQVPRWQQDITEMANNITFIGAFVEVETTESGQINGTTGPLYKTTGISITKEPVSVKLYGPLTLNPETNTPADNTVLKGGEPQSTGTFVYRVDKPAKLIIPYGTFTDTKYYQVRYSMAVPVPVNMYDQISIDTYGEFKKTITLEDVRSVSDAETRGQNYLSRYKNPFTYTTLKVKSLSTLSLAVGENIRVVDNVNTPVVDGTYTINKHRTRYPGDYEEIDV
jgi:hypothetical protein